MIYPGYLLNPGDMFQVEPERVLFATGAPKDARERRAGRKIRQKQKASIMEEDETSSSETQAPASDSAPEPDTESPPNPKENVLSLLNQAKSLLNSTSTSSLSGKRKQDLRAFQRLLKKTLSRSQLFPQQTTTLTDSLDAQLQELTQKLNLNSSTSTSRAQDASSQQNDEAGGSGNQGINSSLTPENSKVLRRALEEARDNPIDVTKPYATPWRPRLYMSAFAFIPRYLEVHHKICSAVYLRHPVARPGLGEVPSPFGNESNSLAFNWYLRRR